MTRHHKHTHTHAHAQTERYRCEKGKQREGEKDEKFNPRHSSMRREGEGEANEPDEIKKRKKQGHRTKSHTCPKNIT